MTILYLDFDPKYPVTFTCEGTIVASTNVEVANYILVNENSNYTINCQRIKYTFLFHFVLNIGFSKYQFMGLAVQSVYLPQLFFI